MGSSAQNSSGMHRCREGFGEVLGGFGAEAAHVQQGSGEGSGEGLGRFVECRVWSVECEV